MWSMSVCVGVANCCLYPICRERGLAISWVVGNMASLGHRAAGLAPFLAPLWCPPGSCSRAPTGGCEIEQRAWPKQSLHQHCARMHTRSHTHTGRVAGVARAAQHSTGPGLGGAARAAASTVDVTVYIFTRRASSGREGGARGARGGAWRGGARGAGRPMRCTEGAHECAMTRPTPCSKRCHTDPEISPGAMLPAASSADVK